MTNFMVLCICSTAMVIAAGIFVYKMCKLVNE